MAAKKTQHEIAMSGVEEDCEDTIAVSPACFLEIDAENGSKEEESLDDTSITSQDFIISLGPPPSLPLIVVNLVERLCGFIRQARRKPNRYVNKSPLLFLKMMNAVMLKVKRNNNKIMTVFLVTLMQELRNFLKMELPIMAIHPIQEEVMIIRWQLLNVLNSYAAVIDLK
jgi:hypothetical protein